MKIISILLGRWLLGSAVVLVWLTGCGRQSESGGESAAAARKPVIVVTVFPIANLVDQLVGDWVVVRTLPTGDEQAVAALGGADVLVVSGTARDAAVESRARGLGRHELEVIRFTELTGEHEDLPAAAAPWLDPLLANRFVAALAPHLQRLVPDRAAPLRTRVMLLRTDLLLLHQEFAARFGDGPHRKLAAWDATFDSMTARFGFETPLHLADVLAQSEGNANRVADAAERVRTSGAANLCAAIGTNDHMLTEIATRAGVTVLWLDPVGGPGQPERSTYEKLLRWNLEALLAAQYKK